MGKFNKSGFSVTVSGNLPPYEQGQVLTKESDIADYWRVAMEEGDVTLTMDDDAIIAVVKSVPYFDTEGETGYSSDWDVQVCETLESRNSSNSDRATPLVDVSVRKASGSTAGLVAEKLDQDETFRKYLHDAVYAPEKVKLGPLNLLKSFLRVYGIDVSNHGEVGSVKAVIDAM